MARITRSALIPFSARQMYDLVDDIDAYSEFLPGCVASAVLERTDTEAVGTMTLSAVGVKKAFTTRNTLYPGERIHLALVDGPFSRLEGDWLFQQLGDDGSKITLDIEFEFSNPIVDKAFGLAFRGVLDSLVDAFCKRAGRVYAES